MNRRELTHQLKNYDALGESGWDDGRSYIPCRSLPPDVLRMVQCLKPRSPFEGFGALRLRTYRARLTGLESSPQQVFSTWKNHFSSFWPEGNYFLPCGAGIEPGTLGVILLSMHMGVRIVTGARVMYVDETSFSLTTLQGHMFAGWITFSTFLEDGQPVLQIQALVRPGDPLFELTFLLGVGTAAEDRFWHAGLRNFARHLGVEPVVEQVNRSVDRSIQWRYFGNIWYNAGIRSIPRFFGRSLKKIINQPGVKSDT